MKFIFLSLFCFLSIMVSAQSQEFEMKDGDTVYVMKQYFLATYIAGPNRNQDSTTLSQLQKAHLEHIGKMAKAGVICMAGPLEGDKERKGILVFKTATIEEAITWIKQDPMVLAGRLSFEIISWWAAKGSKLD
jgi:uncharacterized protein YciI